MLATKLENGKSTKAVKNTLTKLYSLHLSENHVPILDKELKRSLEKIPEYLVSQLWSIL